MWTFNSNNYVNHTGLNYLFSSLFILAANSKMMEMVWKLSRDWNYLRTITLSPFAILFSSFSKWSSKVHPWYGGWKDTRGKTCSRQEALFRIRASSVRNDTCVYHWRMYVFKNVQVTVQVWTSLCLFPKILVYGMTRQFNPLLKPTLKLLNVVSRQNL